MIYARLPRKALHLLLGLLVASPVLAGDDAPPALFIVGQDLTAIRGYMRSDCCALANGTTAYVSLYSVLDPAANYGGLGIDGDGNPVTSEAGWGAGPVSAWKSVHEFNVDHLAIGLWIAENANPGGLSAIASGKYNEHIDQLGRFIRQSGVTVLLRIGYEFDGAWNQGFDDTARYIAAWRTIVDRLRASGTDNVEFVWQASTSVIDDIVDAKREDIADWYPGDDYVDWAGLSWFTNPDAVTVVRDRPKNHASLGELAAELVEFARQRGLPVMIAESTPQGYDLANNTKANISRVFDGPTAGNLRAVSNDEIWEDWYAPLFEFMNANSDTVRAFAYINCHWKMQPMWGPPYADDEGYWGDTRLEVNDEIGERFTTAVNDWRDRANGH